jgi:hypothetical protein
MRIAEPLARAVRLPQNELTRSFGSKLLAPNPGGDFKMRKFLTLAVLAAGMSLAALPAQAAGSSSSCCSGGKCGTCCKTSCTLCTSHGTAGHCCKN